MSKPEFVHLHVHSHGSLLDGFSTASEYLDKVEQLGMRGIGLTDHGNTFGAYDLVRAANSAGKIGIPGAEFYVAPINPLGARVKGPVYYGPGGQKVARKDVSGDGAFLHLTVWAHTQEGMRNLFRLSSLSFKPENFYSKPRIDFDMLAEHSEGLIVSTGCPSSEISTRFQLGQDDKAYEYARRLKDVFGERLFIEVMDHNMSIDLERVLLPKQLEMSKKLGIQLLATNDAHYANADDAKHHEEMLASQSGSRMSETPIDEGGTRFAFEGKEYYLKTSDQMAELFPDKDYPNAISNTLLIAEMAQDIKLDYDPSLMPKANIPAEFGNEVEYYKYLLEKGFEDRYGSSPKHIQEEARRRMAYEFDVIYSSNFLNYMLTVSEYIVWARENFSTRDAEGKILALGVGGGRGSIGGSIHAYLLYISELDPIRWNLIFERFLTSGRGNIYRVEYEDGTAEEIVVSEEKNVQTADGALVKKYIHELAPGDVIVGEDI